MRLSKDRVGELFISGYFGETPPKELLFQIEKQALGGIILFAENCTNHEKLRRSIEQLQALSDKPLFIAIDQEGGRVCRLKGPPIEYLSAESYGENSTQNLQDSYELKSALERYRVDFGLAAAYMSELGINLLLGPVCDLRPQFDNLKESSALSERTFSADPDIVGAFAKVTIEVGKENNLLCCLKHAPGLGSVQADPHFTLGASPLSAQEFSQRDFLPFRTGCSAGASMIMTSHFLIREHSSLPVTFSKEIVSTVIRKELPKDVTLITDDLNMGALKTFGSADDVCLTAFNCGHDLLLARSNTTIDKGISALSLGLDSGTVSDERFSEALGRIDALRNTLEPVA